MMTPSLRNITRAACALVALALLPMTSQAQERMREFTEGDGRIHGAPTLQVSEMDLHPGQVQTINLHPGFHTVLEFPYPIARVDAGDPEIFLAAIVGNKLSLKATKLARSETSMTIILADADLTVVPFVIRTDETQPMLYVVRYTDPVSKHLNEAESRIADRLARENEQRIAELAEMRLRQQLLWAGEVVAVNRQAEVGAAGERIMLRIENAQTFVGDGNTSQVHLRYRIHNGTVAPMEDLYFIVRVVRHKRKFLFFESRSEREVYDVRDVRTANPIPAGTAARGLLIFDAPELRKDESIEVEAVAFNNQRHIVVDRVLVGR